MPLAELTDTIPAPFAAEASAGEVNASPAMGDTPPLPVDIGEPFRLRCDLWPVDADAVLGPADAATPPFVCTVDADDTEAAVVL